MKLGRFGRMTAASAAAILLTSMMSSPALAADHTMYTLDDNPGGRVEFTEYGDIIKLCDVQADGHYVVLGVYDEFGNGWWDYASGNGNCITHRASQGGEYNLYESTEYKFTISLMETGGLDYEFRNVAFWLNDH
ncbi:hypothetical protein D7147_09365 [Micromonospora musae]|uniref:Secreted protein n=1 Tax=Micromonospora musae TaxID=1894970 RepID=A0A3A9Y6B7_9ACTN|nr:hypothetical protein [Micromonospora musae]RKN21004.1 hypothetical protein D7147_09365 [Micromonospora musae]RKN32183.1 hypothetical protein D7044_12980 [Micromonospora musae]